MTTILALAVLGILAVPILVLAAMLSVIIVVGKL